MKFEKVVTLKSLIQQFQHGVETISRSNIVSSFGFQMSMAGLLGIAGFVFALKDSKLGTLSSIEWLPKIENASPKLCSVPGLQNLGNNCYLNVILQALASCSYFQLFLQKILEEFEVSAVEDRVDGFPLAIALAAVVEDLRVVDRGRAVLCPRRVMLAMSHYIQNFDLTSQQDAAEAFLHLLTSLREEFSDCFLPNLGSLAEVCATSYRIITPRRIENHSEQARWQQHYLGPFDGILGSILTCRSCSSQISLNFESFYSLPLSPVLDSGSSIMVGCTIEDCLKQFTVTEQIENYHCSHCWHIAAVKYLFATGVNEEDIENIKRCTEQDFCDCRRHFPLDKLPWSNKFSCTLKQISIARCPKILCIHLKRVSINFIGELVKLQGHISFPLVLDFLPFTTSGVGIKNWEENMRRGQVEQQNENPSTCSNQLTIPYEQRQLNHVYRLTRGGFNPKELASADMSRFTENSQVLLGESIFPQTAGFPETMHEDMHTSSGDQLTESSEVVPLDTCLYRLVAVVEHFGRAGSGHYTVCRSVSVDPSEAATPWWFSVSDSEVRNVSQDDVLAAEASLLFYEKI